MHIILHVYYKNTNNNNLYRGDFFTNVVFEKTSEIKIKTNKCKRTKNMKFIRHLH